MNEGTVTISIERFRELEAFEKAIKEDRKFVFQRLYYTGCNGWIHVSDPVWKELDHLQKDMKELRSANEAWARKAQDKPWYKFW